jgi:LCP family protein required for cell wall assembly
MPRPARPNFTVYRGRRSRGPDPIAERVRSASAPPASGPSLRPGSPVVLPAPGQAPPRRRPPAPSRRPSGPQGPKPRRRFPVRRALLIGIPALLVLLVAWVAYGYVQFSNSMDKANKRISPATRAQLTPGGSILSSPSTILVLGSDRRPGETSSRSDSILLLRSDPGKGTMAELSIPRDLRVEVPGVGPGKINSAYAAGGAPLAIKTVRDLVGVPINHVVLVDFGGFRRLIDALGGVTINNPEKIISNSFDGTVWRFAKGTIHLDGRHALAYSRVRENTLNPADNDLTRGLRQQRVLSAMASSLASPSSLFSLPSIGRAIADPLSTDLSANDLLELGWRKERSSRTLHCHLGGTPAGFSTELIGGEENRQVVEMWLGHSAPQPPPPGNSLAPGCTIS